MPDKEAWNKKFSIAHQAHVQAFIHKFRKFKTALLLQFAAFCQKGKNGYCRNLATRFFDR
jgi:hypothetical protein